MTDGGTAKVGPKGQIVIPKAIRDRLGIEPGDRLQIDQVDREVHVRPLFSVKELRGIFADTPGGTRELEEEHRREIELEERKAARWGVGL